MLILFVFILWLIFWSFISVLVYRIKNNQPGIFFWRSKCPNCNHTLWFFDLFPFFSYIFLRWKCRYCSKNISIIYPLLELFTWFSFIFTTYLVLGDFSIYSFLNNYSIVLYSFLITIFIVAIIFYDILFYEISFILAGILWILLLVPQFIWIIWDWKLALILWLAWFLFFILIWYLRKFFRKIDGIWWWDAIWAILVWFITPIFIDLMNLHNYPSWLVFYIIILLWFLLAWLYSIFLLILWKINNTKSLLPFLPFMFCALILFYFVWEKILNFLIL